MYLVRALAVGTDMLYGKASSNEPHKMGVAEKLGMACVVQMFKLAPVDPAVSPLCGSCGLKLGEGPTM